MAQHVGGVFAIGEDDGGDVRGHGLQERVGTDRCPPPGGVGVEGYADAVCGHIDRAGQGRNLVGGQRGAAGGDAGEPPGSSDADGDGVHRAFDEDRLGTLGQEPASFGEPGQDLALDEQFGVR